MFAPEIIVLKSSDMKSSRMNYCPTQYYRHLLLMIKSAACASKIIFGLSKIGSKRYIPVGYSIDIQRHRWSHTLREVTLGLFCFGSPHSHQLCASMGTITLTVEPPASALGNITTSVSTSRRGARAPPYPLAAPPQNCTKPICPMHLFTPLCLHQWMPRLEYLIIPVKRVQITGL